jgi:PhnB protein
MKMSVHLNFSGNCKDAFSLYQKVFGTKSDMLMTYAEAPAGGPIPADWKDKVMHTSLPLGEGMLMGCDVPPDRSSKPLGGFQVSVQSTDQGEVKRVFEGLSEGGSVQMPLAPTFWSPLFGMCTDKFGVGWMVGAPGEPPKA